MSNHLKIIENAVLKAGKILARDFGEVENLQVSKKGPGNFVTSADLKVERILIEELQASFPDYSILSEEAGYIKGTDERYTFIIDPIDGTSNFMHALPFFCISVGLQEKVGNKEKMIAGVVYAPALNELFTAEEGQGALMNDRRLLVSGRTGFEESLFAGYISRTDEKQRDKDMKAMEVIKAHTRMYGAAALELCYVAAGKLDGMWHCNLKPWDIAAGSIIVREARGIVSEIGGGSDYIKSGSLIASNKDLYDKLNDKLVKCY
jgi:myo-inositol-1(or 4)-monophosphatase